MSRDPQRDRIPKWLQDKTCARCGKQAAGSIWLSDHTQQYLCRHHLKQRWEAMYQDGRQRRRLDKGN